MAFHSVAQPNRTTTTVYRAGFRKRLWSNELLIPLCGYAYLNILIDDSFVFDLFVFPWTSGSLNNIVDTRATEFTGKVSWPIKVNES